MLETGQHEVLQFTMCGPVPLHLLDAFFFIGFSCHMYSVRGKVLTSAPFGTCGYFSNDTERHAGVLDLRRESVNYCDSHTPVKSLFYEDSSGFIVRS